MRRSASPHIARFRPAYRSARAPSCRGAACQQRHFAKRSVALARAPSLTDRANRTDRTKPEKPPNCTLAKRTQERGTYLWPLGLIRLLAARLKIRLYFSCCLQRGSFRARCSCIYSPPPKRLLQQKAVCSAQPEAKAVCPPNEPGEQIHYRFRDCSRQLRSAVWFAVAQPALHSPQTKPTSANEANGKIVTKTMFEHERHDAGGTNPRGQPSLRFSAKRTRGHASHYFSQTNPGGSAVSILAKPWDRHDPRNPLLPGPCAE